MPDEIPPQTPPQTPTVDHASIEKARLEERTKLRGELDALKADLLKATTSVTQLTTQLTELTAAKQLVDADLATVKAAASDTGIDVEKLITQASSAIAARFEPKLKALETELSTERAARRSETLSNVRTRLISEAAQANGFPAGLLEAMVTGTDEDTLKASIAERVELLKATLPASDTTNQDDQQQTQTQTPAATFGLPAAGRANAGVQPSVRQMTDAEWRKEGAALKKKVMSRYAQPGFVGR